MSLTFFLSILININLLIHPFYVSVSEIKYTNKTYEVSIKIFLDNIEKTLSETQAGKVDLANDKLKAQSTNFLQNYILSHFVMEQNKKRLTLQFVGFEIEDGAVMCFVSANVKVKPKQLVIRNSLLYELFPKQTNFVYLEFNGKKWSDRVSNPKNDMLFNFNQ